MWVLDFDVVVLDRVPDQEQHVRCVFIWAIVDTFDPKFHCKIAAFVAKVTQFIIGWEEFIQDVFVGRDGLFDDARDKVGCDLL